MQKKLKPKKITVVSICCLMLFIGGCAGGARQAEVVDRTVSEHPTASNIPAGADDGRSQQGDSSTPLNQRNYQLEQAENFDRLADNTSPGIDIEDSALSAAEFYIQANDIQSAEASIQALNPANLPLNYRNRYLIVAAYIDYSRQMFQPALNRLNTVLDSISQTPESQDQASDELTQAGKRQRVDALLLSSFCLQSLGQFDYAIAALLERENLLYGASRAETSRYIWQVIGNLEAEQKQSIIASTANPAVRNRIAQSLQGEVGSSAPIPRQFDLWRDNSESHERSVLSTEWSELSTKSIAVLLPLSSRYGKAAQAVKDGIEYQHSLNTSAYKPRLEFYDVGDSPWQIQQYYNAARQRSDLVIGPIGKDYANQLSSSAYASSNGSGYSSGYPSTAPAQTILLGGDSPLTAGFTRLTLSPERDAQIVSERGAARGYVNAAVLTPDTDNGRRMADAFSRNWLNNGGKLAKVVTYSPSQFDHSTELKQLFSINQSEYRHTKLSNVLGFRPKFSAYRRKDIDFVFMVADNKTGRILRPQINFYGGTKLAVIAGSAIYNGIANATENIDLDGTSFPVAPWALRSDQVASYAGQLNLLYAIGTDAYRLAANVNRMASDSNLNIEGNMGMLNIHSSGEILYQPLWATYQQGLAVTSADLEPLTTPLGNSRRFDNDRRAGRNLKSKRSYDESNWDAGESRRKSRP